MIRTPAAALALALLAGTAHAGQIDYFCLYTNQAAAMADPVMTAGSNPFWNAALYNWRPDVVYPGIQVITPQAVFNGVSTLTGYWLMIAQPQRNSALENDNACKGLWLDRAAAVANQPFIVGGTISGGNRQNLQFSPVPLGSNYPQPLGQ